MKQLNIVTVTLRHQTLLKQLKKADVISYEIMNQKNQKGKQISLICAKCEQEDPRQTLYI